MVTGGGVTAVRFSRVIKSDLGRKSGGTGCVCVQRIRLGDWDIGKAFGIMLSLGSTHTPTYSARAQMCHGGWGGCEVSESRPCGSAGVYCCACTCVWTEYNRVPCKLDKTVF